MADSARPCVIAQEDGRFLFAWHHSPCPDRRRGAAVVLCSSLGGEHVRVYRVWRALAERLAALGFDVLRFDYEGTGESAGNLQGTDAWLANVQRVVLEAREICGSAEVAVVGLRIGATLALHATALSGGVERLVLWSPFRSGRTYVRELKALARLSGESHAAKNDEAGILAAGYVLPASVASALERLDVDSLTASPARKVLIVDRDDRVPDRLLAEHLERLGTCVTRVRPSGTVEMLAHGTKFNMPGAALNAIVGWFDEWQPRLIHGVSRETSLPSLSQSMNGPGYQERPVRFGSGDRLFGVLTRPTASDTPAPSIILLNTGYEYRVGPHRLYVPLARELAARGHLILRVRSRRRWRQRATGRLSRERPVSRSRARRRSRGGRFCQTAGAR